MQTKQYYKEAIEMAWPSVLESFFIALAGIIDTMMVGSLGSYAIAAVGLTTQPKFIGLTAFFAMNVAVSAVVARRRGEKNIRGIHQVFSTAMIIALILCAIITVLSVVYAHEIISLSGSQPDTHQAAVDYFQIIMGGMVFNVVAMTINAAQRGCGNTKIAFITNLTSSIINVIFNYLLIGGKLGFPALGIKGAAIATVLGTVVATIMSIMSLFNKNSLIQLPYIIKNRMTADWQNAKTILKLGSNMFVENLAMRIGFLATALTAASLGTSAFAVHNAGMNVLSLGFSFANGMQVAAVALAGNALGRGDAEKAISYGQVCQRIGFGISIALSIFLFFFGEVIMSIYFTDPNEIAHGTMITQFMTVIVLLQISQIIYGACLRAGGDVKYTLIVGIISVSLIRSITTIVLVNVFQLGLIGVWIGILSDQISRFILMRYRFKKGYWTQIAI